MHGFTTHHGYTFAYNGDFSGNVQIRENFGTVLLELPVDDVLEFAAEYVRNRRISAVEAAGWEELLGA